MGNSSFQGSKLEFQSLETNRFTKENYIFRYNSLKISKI